MSISINIHELANKYIPIFVFDKNEEYYPCSIEYLIQNSDLYKDEQLISPSTIYNMKEGNKYIFKGDKNGDLDTAPLYYFYRVTDTWIDIVYVLYFAFSGPLYLFNLLKIEDSSHPYDIEHVILRFNKTNLLLNSVYFSAHSDEGKWVNYNDLHIIHTEHKTSPLIYVSRNSHAMYPTSGTHFRICGILNDYNDFGNGWLTNCLIEADEDQWVGDWGNVESLAKRDWWKETREDDSNCFTRLFPFNLFSNLRKRHIFIN